MEQGEESSNAPHEIGKNIRVFVGFSLAGISYAADPVHLAEYADAEGNRVVVRTFDDGSLQVSTANGIACDKDAVEVLRNRGVELDINARGHILGVVLSQGATQLLKPCVLIRKRTP